MIPVLNEPILHHLICHCASQGVTEIILTTSYLEERIRNYFGRGAEYRTAIQYIHEEEEMGTAGGVKNAEKLIDETFIVLARDHVTDIKLRIC